MEIDVDSSPHFDLFAAMKIYFGFDQIVERNIFTDEIAVDFISVNASAKVALWIS